MVHPDYGQSWSSPADTSPQAYCPPLEEARSLQDAKVKIPRISLPSKSLKRTCMHVWALGLPPPMTDRRSLPRSCRQFGVCENYIHTITTKLRCYIHPMSGNGKVHGKGLQANGVIKGKSEPMELGSLSRKEFRDIDRLAHRDTPVMVGTHCH